MAAAAAVTTYQLRQTKTANLSMLKFSVPQIEYPLGGSCKKGSHVYFLLQDFWVILFCQIVLLSDINVVLMSQ